MGRKLEHPDRWRHPKYNIGYVENYGGVAYSRIAGRRRTLGMVFADENKRAALIELEERIKDHLAGRGLLHRTRRRKNLFEVIENFTSANEASLTPSAKRMMAQSLTWFYPKDMPMDEKKLAAEIVKRKAGLKSSTLAGYLSRLQRFFKWCVTQGELDSVPTDIISKPKVKYKGGEIYERSETDALDRVAKTPAQQRAAAAYRFLAATGLRIAEAIAVEWSDISPTGIRVRMGKGGVERIIPIAVINDGVRKVVLPDAEAAINELRKISPQKPLAYSAHTTLRTMLKFLAKEAGFELAGRCLHTFRSTAEYRWENEIGLPFDIICDIAGHSMAVRESHYRKKRGERELGARMVV